MRPRPKRYAVPKDSRRRNGPVVIVRPGDDVEVEPATGDQSADAWRAALELADGDRRRLTVEPDGSVVIHNQPINQRR